MKKSPAFQFYPDDFVGSGKVGQMNPEQIGIYIMLLCLDWNSGGFVYIEENIARWCRVKPRQMRAAWPVVRECFVERGGRMYNPRLELERERQAAWAEKSRKGAQKTNEKKHENAGRGGDALATAIFTPERSPNGRTPSVSVSPSPVTALTTNNNSGDISAQQLVRGLLPNDTARVAFDEIVKRATGKLTFVSQVQCLAGAISSTLPETYSWAEIGSAMVDLAQSGGPVQRLPSFCRNVRRLRAEAPPDAGEAFMRLMHAERAPQVPFAVWLESQTAPTQEPERANATA